MYGYEIWNNDHIILYKEVGIDTYVWVNILEYNDDVIMETYRELVNFADLDEVFKYLDKETHSIDMSESETKGVVWFDNEKEFKNKIEKLVDKMFY